MRGPLYCCSLSENWAQLHHGASSEVLEMGKECAHELAVLAESLGISVYVHFV